MDEATDQAMDQATTNPTETTVDEAARARALSEVVPEVAAAPARRGIGRLGTIGVLAVTAAVIVAVSVLANGGSGTAAGSGGLTSVDVAAGSGPAPTIGQAAPDFTAPGSDGKAVTLSSFKGHPLWLTFGASWCQPCRAENPDVVATYEQHKANGLVVVQVYMGEDQAAVTDYANRVGIPYVKVPDPKQALASQYRILGIPTHYFIDSSGVLRSMKIGSLTPEAMAAALKEIGG